MASLRIGLTGGIASGKSLVAGALAGHGALIVDNDLLAHQVVSPGTPGLAAVVHRFGPGVLDERGALDRKRLAGIVFADPGALADLNSIVHPLVATAAVAIEQQAPADAVVVHDIPLLVESGQARDFDLVVVVDVPEELQLRRLLARGGIDEAQARARIDAQASRQERLAWADAVIDNSGARADTLNQVDSLWRRLTAGVRPGSSGR